MTQPIHLGISTCPNDTFAFAALLNREVDWCGLDFRTDLLDIAELNTRLIAGDFDVCKTSFYAALELADDTVVLPTGSALGFGVGPLLLAARPNDEPSNADQITLCPGTKTTATLLFSLFYPDTTSVQQTVFSDIMPRLKQSTADFGVCIHEGRFTWQSEGLHLVQDLGERWEQETQSPLPLGGIVARKRLDAETIRTVNNVIRSSLDYAWQHPQETLATMRRYAQEFDDDVLMQHVQLYVNEWTRELGDTGASALRKLSTMAKSIGLVAQNTPDIEVFGEGMVRE